MSDPGHGTDQFRGDDAAPTLLEVGRIAKAHGLRGEVVVRLTTDRSERVEPGSVLSSDKGDLTVEASKPHHDRWLVRFEGCSTREDADRLNGTVLLAEPIEDSDVLWVHDLVGKCVVSVDGVSRGLVESLIDAPGSDLLVLDSGALVPVAFIVGEPTATEIHVDTPEGLFELFDS